MKNQALIWWNNKIFFHTESEKELMIKYLGKVVNNITLRQIELIYKRYSNENKN